MGALLGLVFLLTATGVSAQASSTSFFLDPDFDSSGRSKTNATLRIEGTKADIYVEDAYWNSLSATERANMLSKIDGLEKTFSTEIYSKVRNVFGSEWSPGIDGVEEITVLFTNMDTGIGGYFREEDELRRTSAATSNEREMFYINTDFLNNTRQAEAFMAHEFQHLVNYNERMRTRNIRDELWISEMLAEVAPTIAGLNEIYAGSNLAGRVSTFVNNSSNPLIKWDNQSEDYSSASIFGHYLLDHYGEEFFTEFMDVDETGEEGINETLSVLGRTERFDDIFANWTVAVLLNDCDIPPAETFCFTNPNLNYNNLHIEFGEGVEGGSLVTSTENSYPWSGKWHSYIRYRGEPRPEDHYFHFTFKKQDDSIFKVPYVLYPHEGDPKVFFLQLEGNEGRFYVDSFGYTNEQLVIIPVNQSMNAEITYSYTTTGELSTEPMANTTESVPASTETLGVEDGSVVRAEGGTKVYIIKGEYKRWIQTAELFNMYGHLRWEDIIDVPENILDQYTESTLVRAAGTEKVYFTSINGEKRWIETEDELFDLGFNFDMVYIINEKELEWFETI